MSNYLYSLIKNYRSLSIIGMCKNAGKTTVLNHIIHAAAAGDRQWTLALTSIGRDGETTDLVTGTAKPRIFVYAGSLIATAAGLLETCDITKELVLTTGISTPLGEIVILRALSSGYVQLAGPSMISQLEQLSRTFSQLESCKIIIDGAVGRKTLCTRSLTEATILCTGASCGNNMDAVITDTLYVTKILSLPVISETIRQKIIAVKKNNDSKIILCGKEYIALPQTMSIEEGLRKNIQNDTNHIYINGALSNMTAQSLIMSGAKLAGVTLIVDDASKILITAANYEKLRLRQCEIKVMEGINLLAITINPFSAYGHNFDKDRFRQSLAEQTKIPIINVEDFS